MTKSFFKIKNARFLEDIEFGRKDKVRDIVFDKEVVSLLVIAINNDHVSITNIIQEANPDHQNNVKELPI